MGRRPSLGVQPPLPPVPAPVEADDDLYEPTDVPVRPASSLTVKRTVKPIYRNSLSKDVSVSVTTSTVLFDVDFT